MREARLGLAVADLVVARQALRAVPHAHTNGTVTRSPGRQRRTSAPTASTTPPARARDVRQRRMSASWPIQPCQSLRHRPVARTRTTAPCGAGAGRGRRRPAARPERVVDDGAHGGVSPPRVARPSPRRGGRRARARRRAALPSAARAARARSRAAQGGERRLVVARHDGGVAAGRGDGLAVHRKWTCEPPGAWTQVERARSAAGG